jgi:hypothetical protein
VEEGPKETTVARPPRRPSTITEHDRKAAKIYVALLITALGK